MITYLVTGGCGFIGSCFVRFLLDRREYIRVINIDSLTYAGKVENLSGYNDYTNYSFIKGDIRDKQVVSQIFLDNDIDYIVNFAAESHVDRSIDGPDIFFDTNVMGTLNLLNCALKVWYNNFEGKRFLQVSTDEVYGTLALNDDAFTEQSPLLPNSPYSASKASADLLVRSYFKTYGLPIIITRCCNNYGPFQFPEKLIPLMISNALSDKPLPVYGDGLQRREWIYVQDHCEAIDLVIQKGEIGNVYNIGTDGEYPNLDVVKTILFKLGKSDGLIKHVKDRPGHDVRYAMNSSKIQKELDWRCKYTFEQGMDITIDWYRKKYEMS